MHYICVKYIDFYIKKVKIKLNDKKVILKTKNIYRKG